MVSSQGEKGPEARHLGNTRTGKAESVADSGGQLSSSVTPAFHHHTALSRATHCFPFNQSGQLFSFGVFLLHPEFQELQGEAAANNTGPELHFKAAAFIIVHTPFAGASSVLSREPNSPGDFPQ